MSKPKSTIGLKNLVTAELLTDTESELTFGPVEAVVGAINIGIKDSSGKADVQQADDGEYDRLYPMPVLGFSMEAADVPPAWRGKFFGHKTDANGVTVANEKDRPAYRAFGFKSEKADGSYRYVWLYKCIPLTRASEDNYKTKPRDAVERQTGKIEWEAIPTEYTGDYQSVVDDNTAEFASVKSTFFSAPYVPVMAGDIEITTQPTDQYLAGGAGGTLTIVAEVDGGAPDAYQWYKATGKAYNGVASAYTGNSGASLTIPTNIAAGTHYFYCKLSNAGSRDVYSEIAVVIVGA